MSTKNYKEIWDNIHEQYFNGTITYDFWLEDFKNILDNVNTEILDLGCGAGNNLLYLYERGKKVIACDYSDKAIEIVNRIIPNIKTLKFDITTPFPINDNFFELVIADLSLHYFDYDTTVKILKEIKRILKTNGYLAFRVNSTKDFNYGSIDGKEVEHNYYVVENMMKRFFDKEDIGVFFKDWNIISLNEETMDRYTSIKVLWKGLIQVKK